MAQDRSSIHKHLIKISVGFFVCTLLVAGYFYLESFLQRKKTAELESRNVIYVKFLRLQKTFLDMETGLRGYALEGEASFLQPYQEADESVDPLIEELYRLTTIDYKVQKLLRENHDAFREWDKFAKKTVGKISTFQNFEKFDHKTDDGKGLFDDIRKTSKAFLFELEAQLGKKRQELSTLQGRSFWVSILLVLLVLLFYSWFLGKEMRQAVSGYSTIVDDLKKKNKEVDEASKTKDLFLANMSHEIRTPLGAILGFAELLSKDNSLNPETKSHSVFIKRNSEHLLGLVDDLFDISKLVADKFEVNEEPVNLAQFIVDIENYFQSKLNDRRITFNVSLDTRIPTQVNSDPVRLKQIVTNLVGNAIKFSPDGSEVKIIFSFSAGRLQVDVMDNGIGIDKKIHDKIFDAFIQAEGEHSRSFGGAGLGLSISKKLANAMGGDLTLVSSRLKVGSHFRLSLPAEAQSTSFLEKKYRETAQVFDLKETKGVRNEFDFSNKKILLAEDSQENQILFKIFLESAKTNLEIVGNGSDAVRRALADDFDAILMDIQMPGLDGYEAVNILRGSHYRKPIIALTAHAMKGEKEKCLEAGFSDYVSKPVSQQTLLSTLDRNLG